MRTAQMLYAILGPELTSDFVRTIESGDPEHAENLKEHIWGTPRNLKEIAKELNDLNKEKRPPVMLIAMASAMWALGNIHFGGAVTKDSEDRFPALSSDDIQGFTFKFLGDEVVWALRRFGIELPERGDEHIVFNADKTTYNNWVSKSIESAWFHPDGEQWFY
jgi:hypothetical protein